MEKSKRCPSNPEAMPMVLTPSDIGDVLGISKNRVYELVHMGVFPSIKMGKQFRIRKEEFLVWLNTVKKIEFV